MFNTSTNFDRDRLSNRHNDESDSMINKPRTSAADTQASPDIKSGNNVHSNESVNRRYQQSSTNHQSYNRSGSTRQSRGFKSPLLGFANQYPYHVLKRIKDGPELKNSFRGKRQTYAGGFVGTYYGGFPKVQQQDLVATQEVEEANS